jgi:hypothetical protein
MKNVKVYRSSRQYEIDMIIDTLKSNFISFLCKEISSDGGVSNYSSLSVAAPDVYYEIFIPKEFEHQAKQLLETLPLSNELDPHIELHRSRKRKLLYLLLMLSPLILFLMLAFLSHIFGLAE